MSCSGLVNNILPHFIRFKAPISKRDADYEQALSVDCVPKLTNITFTANNVGAEREI